MLLEEEFYLENTKPNRCQTMEGSLPGKCANMVFPYVAMQGENPEQYDAQEGLAAGTLFPGLNLPFFKSIRSRMNCDNRALCELMALDFAITELGLYLDTHKNDKEALRLYREYVALEKDGRKRYEAIHGPLMQKKSGDDRKGWDWIDSPWPWEYEGGRK